MSVTATVTARMDIVQRGGNDFGTDKFSPVVESVLKIANWPLSISARSRPRPTTISIFLGP